MTSLFMRTSLNFALNFSSTGKVKDIPTYPTRLLGLGTKFII